MDRGARRATVHGVAEESDLTEQLSTITHTHSTNTRRSVWEDSIMTVYIFNFKGNDAVALLTRLRKYLFNN